MAWHGMAVTRIRMDASQPSTRSGLVLTDAPEHRANMAALDSAADRQAQAQMLKVSNVTSVTLSPGSHHLTNDRAMLANAL